MVVPNGFATVAWFEWGPRGAFTQATSPLSLGDGAAVMHITAPITGLTNRGLYQCRLVASNAAGLVSGATQLFTTGKKPIAWAYNSSYGVANVPGSLSNAVAVACGTNHSLALTGRRNGGRLGAKPLRPDNVPAGLSNIVSLAAGANHNLALGADGTVTAWGNNSNGQTNVPAGLEQRRRPGWG